MYRYHTSYNVKYHVPIPHVGSGVDELMSYNVKYHVPVSLVSDHSLKIVRRA